jgi:predicted RND superfamily exporter protein
MNQFRKKLIDWILTRPKRVLLLFGILNLILLPGLSLVQSDFTYKAWYSDNDPKVVAFQDFEKIFGNDDSLIILVTSEKEILTKKNLTQLNKLEENLLTMNEVIRVDSFNSFQYIESRGHDLYIDNMVSEETLKDFNKNHLLKKIQKEPALKNYLINHDNRALILQAFIRPAIDSIPDHELITIEANQILREFRKRNPDLQVHLTGPVTLVHDFKKATVEDMSLLIPLLYTIFILILFLVYRSKTTIFLIFTMISASTLLMLGASGLLGLKINTLTSGAPTILMTIALADAIHIFGSFFNALKNEFSYQSSLRYSLKKNFFPTLLTSITTAFGFLSFFDSLVEPVSELGIMTGLGVLFAWLVTYFFLAPLLVLMPRFFKKFTVGSRETNFVEKEIAISAFSKALTQRIFHYKTPILTVTALLIVISLITIPKIQVNMDPIEQLKSTHPTVIANNKLVKLFGYSSTVEIQVDSGIPEGIKSPDFLARVESYMAWLEQQDYISKVIGVNNILKSLNMALNNGDEKYYRIADERLKIAESLLLYTMGLPFGKDINNLVSLDNRRLHLTAQLITRDSKNALVQINEMKQKAQAFNLDASLTGKTPLFHDLTPYIVETFLKSFFLAFVIITIILIFSLRSLSLGFLALIPNLLPLAIGATCFYFTGFDVDMGTVLVASVCLGISVDDSIHFLFEFNKFKRWTSKVIKSLERFYNDYACTLHDNNSH